MDQDSEWHTSEFIRSATADDVRARLDAGADPNAQGARHLTPLHRAAEGGSHEVVVALLQAGADPNARDAYGTTPLHRAATHARPETVTALVQAGADIALRDGDQTPLHWAARSDTPDNIAALLRAGADIEARATNGWTPLHRAVSAGKPAVVTMLLQAGADVNARDRTDSTPLHVSHSAETTSQLLQADADIEARSGHGATPLHTAAQVGTPECVAVLLDAGADIRVENAFGEKPLDLARKNESLAGTTVLQQLGAAVRRTFTVERVLAAYERGERDFANIEVPRRHQGRSFAGQDLADADFSGSVLKDLDFRGAHFTGAIFRGATISYSDFSRACLAGADLSDATARHARFVDADLSRARCAQLDATGAVPTMTATALTVRDADGREWGLEVPAAVVTAAIVTGPDVARALAAAITGELASKHPTAYDSTWTLGDPLPSATPMRVYDEDGDLLASYTDSQVMPVGVGVVATMAGWRISCAAAPGDDNWDDCEEALGPDWQQVYPTRTDADRAALDAQHEGDALYSNGDERFRDFSVVVVPAQVSPGGYLVHTCDEHGSSQAVTAWYEDEPTASDVERHTGTFGGIIERLSDSQWNYGAGWYERQDDAVNAVYRAVGLLASKGPTPTPEL